MEPCRVDHPSSLVTGRPGTCHKIYPKIYGIPRSFLSPRWKVRVEHDIWCWYCLIEATWRRSCPTNPNNPQQTTILTTTIDHPTMLEWHNIHSSPVPTWCKWLVTQTKSHFFWILDLFWLGRGFVTDSPNKTADTFRFLNRESYENQSTFLFFWIHLVSMFRHDSVGPFFWCWGEWFPVFSTEASSTDGIIGNKW